MRTKLILVLVSLMSVSAMADVEVSVDRAVVISGPIMGSLENTAKQMWDMSKDKSRGHEPIDLILDSPGGSVVSGFAFINAMESIKAKGTPIRCFVKDMAASMAFSILLHCDERHALARSFLLWHRARVGGVGEPITAPLALKLAEDLQSADSLIHREVMSVLSRDMEPSEVTRHFEAQTLHIAANLGTLLPHVLHVHDSIPGLYEAFYAKKKDVSILDLLFGGRGSIMPATPDTLFSPGTIIYINNAAFQHYINLTE